MRTRYQDAYGVAHDVVGYGRFLKRAGLVLMVVSIIALAALAERTEVDVRFTALGCLIGIGLGASIYSRGILTSAQGQMLLAQLDTAVSVSPFLEDEQRADMMSLG